MRKIKIWINKKFIDIDDAKISIFDRGYLYGDGIFETMRSYAGVVFRIDEHLDRLFNGLKVMKIMPSYNKRYLKNIIYKSLKINGFKSAYIRLTITRGEGRFSLSYSDNFIPNVVIVTKEFGEYPDWMYFRGISAKVVEIRQNELSPVSAIKSTNYLNHILARLDAKDEGCDEAILMNTKGYIAEGAASNIFLVKRNNLTTPSLESGILPGITRKLIIEIAGILKLKVKERRIYYRELLNADEVFFTNSLIEILPVRKIDSETIGDGEVGDITRLLHISYQKQVIREVLF